MFFHRRRFTHIESVYVPKNPKGFLRKLTFWMEKAPTGALFVIPYEVMFMLELSALSFFKCETTFIVVLPSYILIGKFQCIDDSRLAVLDSVFLTYPEHIILASGLSSQRDSWFQKRQLFFAQFDEK